MEDINQIIKHYKQAYSTSMGGSTVKRLPISLVSENDTRLRLIAALSLEVEKRECTFVLDEHTEDKIGRVTRWLFNSNKSGLLLMGTLGNGKSTMLKAIRDIFYPYSTIGDAQDIFDYFKLEQGMRFWNEKLLLIDDLGVEPLRCLNYGEEYHPISRILLHRYNCQQTTIIATNLGLNEIQERYGDRVVDRMFETYEVIKYDRESYRREK